MANESSMKPQLHHSLADDSGRQMSALHRSLPYSQNSADFNPVYAESEVHSVGLNPSSRSFAESTAIPDDKEDGKVGDESLASGADSLSSSSTISSDQDPDGSSLQSFDIESRVPRDMASEILALLDRLESSILPTFDQPQNLSVSEDTLNVFRLVLQGYFFTHLWDDILSFYRSALSAFYNREFCR